MSFSARIHLTADGDVHRGDVVDIVNGDNTEVVKAIDLIGVAVKYLFVGGTFGTDYANYDWMVNISGHFNPEHEPVEGWANDHLSINISQMEREQE